MQIKMLKAVLFLLITTILGCLGDEALTEVIKANDKFTASIFKELARSKDGSLALSGLSADQILSLLASGAKGDTQLELELALNLVRDAETRNNGFRQLTSALSNTKDLNLASRIYAEEGIPINDTFKSNAKDNYKTEIKNSDFKNKEQAANSINKDLDQEANKIGNVIAANNIPDDKQLLLVSELYFNGRWDGFKGSKKGQFSASEGSTKEVDFLSGKLLTKYRTCGYYQAKFLELDLVGVNASMTFILPNERAGIKKLEDDLEGAVEIHNMKRGIVDVLLPKFNIESKLDLAPVLQKLGLAKAFSNDADFSGITSAKNVKLGSVIQKSVVDISESGIETPESTEDKNLLALPFVFKADYPFIYYIREKSTSAVLLVGRYQG